MGVLPGFSPKHDPSSRHSEHALGAAKHEGARVTKRLVILATAAGLAAALTGSASAAGSWGCAPQKAGDAGLVNTVENALNNSPVGNVGPC